MILPVIRDLLKLNFVFISTHIYHRRCETFMWFFTFLKDLYGGFKYNPIAVSESLPSIILCRPSVGSSTLYSRVTIFVALSYDKQKFTLTF